MILDLYHDRFKTVSFILCDPEGRKNLADGGQPPDHGWAMCAPVERENGALLHGDLLLAPLQGAQPLFVVLPVVVTTG